MLHEPAEGQVAPPRRRLARRLALFLVILSCLALGGIYTATSVVVHVDNVVLPGIDLAVPKPVAKVLPGLDSTPAEGSPGTTRINILLLGIDRRPHHDPAVDGPPNTDSIHIISLDPISKTATALSLPRDLYVEGPSPQKEGDFWEYRVNTAFKLAEDYGYPGGGAAFSKRVIEYTFKIPIDYYAVVDWVAFADVIDALGGVWVTVPETLKHVEGFNPRDGNAFTITIPAGTHYMDAITALAYARFRDDERNDFGRIERQQEVMRAAADEALRDGWLTQAPKLYDRFRGVVQTDLTPARLPGLAVLARSIGMDHVKTISLAGPDADAVTRVITPWGEDVLVPRWERMSEIVRGAIDVPALRAEGATVSVVNATGVRGQDERAVAYLRRFLLPPERISIGAPPLAASSTVSGGGRGSTPAASSAVRTTTITYTGNALETATRIAGWLGVPESQVARSEASVRSDGVEAEPAAVIVTLGTDVRLPDDERFLHYRPR